MNKSKVDEEELRENGYDDGYDPKNEKIVPEKYEVTAQDGTYYIFDGTNYTFNSITVIKGDTKKTFYAKPKENEEKLTDELLERVLELILRAKTEEFDNVLCFLSGAWRELGIKVYKKVMDEFYNLIVPGRVVFKRSYLSGAKYTLFEE